VEIVGRKYEGAYEYETGEGMGRWAKYAKFIRGGQIPDHGVFTAATRHSFGIDCYNQIRNEV